jgi:exonuclease SbcC
MWIKSLEIKNFQCHDHLALDFCTGLNAITGESDRGKSAVIRALRWLIFNKPDGQQMRKHGSKETIVSAELDDGTIITRSRSSVTNRYTIKKKGGKETALDNFGVRVPEPIAEAFGIGTAKLSETMEVELSIGSQFDPPFMLYESGSVRAQMLGTLSKTALIDSTIRTINNEVRMRGRHANMIEESVKGIEAELAGFANLEDQHKRLTVIERDLKTLALLKDSVEHCAVMSAALINLNLSIAAREERLSFLTTLPDIDHLELVGRQLERSFMIHDRLGVLNQEMKVIQSTIDKIDAVTPEMMMRADALARVCDEVLIFQRRVQDWKKRYLENQENFKIVDEQVGMTIAMLIEMITREGKCPTCFREIDADALAIIEKELKEE